MKTYIVITSANRINEANDLISADFILDTLLEHPTAGTWTFEGSADHDDDERAASLEERAGGILEDAGIEFEIYTDEEPDYTDGDDAQADDAETTETDAETIETDNAIETADNANETNETAAPAAQATSETAPQTDNNPNTDKMNTSNATEREITYATLHQNEPAYAAIDLSESFLTELRKPANWRMVQILRRANNMNYALACGANRLIETVTLLADGRHTGRLIQRETGETLTARRGDRPGTVALTADHGDGIPAIYSESELLDAMCALGLRCIALETA